MKPWPVPDLMLALGLFWLALGAWRWVRQPTARLQAKIWLLVGWVFIAIGVLHRMTFVD